MNIMIEKIVVPDSRREIVADKVAELVESIREIGLLNPITITNSLQLIAGAHRLEACKQLGWDIIACSVIEGDSLHLELAEIDENLIRNDLDAISIGELAIRRDEILDKLGLRASSGNNRFTKDRGAPGAPVKTTATIAKEIGISKRALQENKQLAKNLIPEQALRKHWDDWNRDCKTVKAPNRGYTTTSLAVPITTFQQAIIEAGFVQWGKDTKNLEGDDV